MEADSEVVAVGSEAISDDADVAAAAAVGAEVGAAVGAEAPQAARSRLEPIKVKTMGWARVFVRISSPFLVVRRQVSCQIHSFVAHTRALLTD